MPELAEVAYYSRQWDPGIGKKIVEARVHPEKRIFRDTEPERIPAALQGKVFRGARTHGKNMLFEFSGGVWLFGHLGMTGKMFTIEGGTAKGAQLHRPGSTTKADKDPKHHHLVMEQAGGRRLVFSDPRLFGKIVMYEGKEPPTWWQELPPQIMGDDFTEEVVAAYFARKKRSPVKSVLLEQERFPGIGNWMADEIVWRAKIDPALPAGELDKKQVRAVWRETRKVTENALRVIGTDWSRPPDSWLFNHRWKEGFNCPRCKTLLERESLRGRTTCYCPECQR